MATWPVALPQQPDRDGFQEEYAFPTLQSDLGGPDLSRAVFTKGVKFITMTFLLTDAQRVIFEDFYEDDTSLGAVPYQWKERGDPANPTRDFRIVGPPTMAYLGGIYYRLSLRVLRKP